MSKSKKILLSILLGTTTLVQSHSIKASNLILEDGPTSQQKVTTTQEETSIVGNEELINASDFLSGEVTAIMLGLTKGKDSLTEEASKLQRGKNLIELDGTGASPIKQLKINALQSAASILLNEVEHIDELKLFFANTACIPFIKELYESKLSKDFINKFVEQNKIDDTYLQQIDHIFHTPLILFFSDYYGCFCADIQRKRYEHCFNIYPETDESKALANAIREEFEKAAKEQHHKITGNPRLFTDWSNHIWDNLKKIKEISIARSTNISLEAAKLAKEFSVLFLSSEELGNFDESSLKMFSEKLQTAQEQQELYMQIVAHLEIIEQFYYEITDLTNPIG